jgi:hypothetical protein
MTLSTVVVVMSATLPVGGAALLVWGLRGRRVGQEPHCRKCGYDLTGLTADRCPECGRIAQGRNVVTGVRRRRRGAIVAGAVLLLVFSSGVGTSTYMRARQVNWYAQLPTWMVVMQANWDDSLAVDELVARHRQGLVTDETVVDLVPHALERQGLEPEPRHVWAWEGWSWTRFLAQLEEKELLSRVQLEQYHKQMVTIDLDIPNKVWLGDEVPISLVSETRSYPKTSLSKSMVQPRCRKP